MNITNNMKIINNIDIEEIKKDLKESIIHMKVPYINYKSKMDKIFPITLCIVIFVVNMFILFNLEFSDSVDKFVSICLSTFGIGIIAIILFFFTDIVIINTIKSNKNKVMLSDKIDDIKTYDDIIDIINLIHEGFEKYKKDPKHGLFDLEKLKNNIESYNILTNKNIIEADMHVVPCKKEDAGLIKITYPDEEGYVNKKDVTVELRKNTKIKDKMIFIYPYENIKLDIPYEE